MLHRRLPAVALLFAAFCAVGCSSTDRQVIRSTVETPMSASVMDTSTQASLWSMDVPPGHTLVLDAHSKGDLVTAKVANAAATRMCWGLYTTGKNDMFLGRSKVDSGSLELPGHPIRIDITQTTARATRLLPSPTAEPSSAPPAAVEEQMEQSTDAAEPLPAEDAPESAPEESTPDATK